MKLYFVCKQNVNNLYDFQHRLPRELFGANPLANGFYNAEGQLEANDPHGQAWNLWFFDDENSARGFAYVMSQKYSNAMYVYGKLSGGFQSVPQPPKEVKVTPQGVLPVKYLRNQT